MSDEIEYRDIDLFFGVRKRALEEAHDICVRLVRPLVNEDIDRLRSDESLEPKPGYSVSGAAYVGQLIQVAAFLCGNEIKGSAPYEYTTRTRTKDEK